MFKSVLAILTVVAVLAVHGLLKFSLLPFKAIRHLWRHRLNAAR